MAGVRRKPFGKALKMQSPCLSRPQDKRDTENERGTVGAGEGGGGGGGGGRGGGGRPGKAKGWLHVIGPCPLLHSISLI